MTVRSGRTKGPPSSSETTAGAEDATRRARPSAQRAQPEEGRADAAYRFLRSAILSNELPAGFQATEVDIAARLGMSRTPVHEAMARLQEEGFVQILPRRGILVKALAPSDLLEIYDVLIGLEGAAAERLASDEADSRATVIATLESHTTAMALALDAGNLEAWADADAAFHDTLVGCCGNSRIRKMTATISGQSHRARRITLHLRPTPMQSVVEHRAIIEAIRSADPIAAGNATRDHRRRARDQLIPILRRIAFATF